MRGRMRQRGKRICSVAAAALLLGVSGGSPWPSSSPSEFMVAPDVLARLQTLSAGLHNEIVLCLKGRIRGDTAFVESFEMPVPRESTPLRSSFDPCPAGTFASWHNHPPSPRPAARGNSSILPESRRRARRLCVLSGTDIGTARKLAYPFVVVSVDVETWCWWSLDEVEGFASRSISPGSAGSGQTRRARRFPLLVEPHGRVLEFGGGCRGHRSLTAARVVAWRTMRRGDSIAR